jgi:hypothetical protein
MSGDFLPKRGEMPEGTLCVSFVAILRARNVERGKGRGEEYLKGAAGGSWPREALGRSR